MQNKYTSNLLKVVKEIEPQNSFAASSVSKISLTSNNSFSIPAGPKFACPGATEACVDCYAMKNRHHFPAVQKKFAKNWLLLRKLERNRSKKSTEKAITLLLDMIPAKAEIFRIHESGDFHSQWAVDVWAEVVRRRPDVSFWAYTRSFNLTFTNLTRHPNFTLWASTDEFNESEAKKFVRRFRKSGVKHAYGPWDHDKELPDNSFACPVTTDKLAVEGACDKCQLCVVKRRVNKHVVFLAH